MSSKSIVEQIKHYQKDIERCPDNSERMIRCIQRLYVLPVLVQHLQETGVGRSVNSLRKFNGEVGEAAKALVAKWKAMVAAEESDDDSSPIKPTDSDRNAPNSQGSAISNKLSKDKINSTSDSKRSDSSKSSSHKRSHSSSSRDIKSEKKSSTSPHESSKKNSSDENNHHRSSSKSKESKHKSEQLHSKNTSSKDAHKVKHESRHKNYDDHSPVAKKRKKMCVKERRKLQETRDSEEEQSSGNDSDESRHSDDSNEASLTGGNHESDVKSSAEEESSDENDQNASGSESDHKWSGSSSSRQSHDKKPRNSNSSSRSPSGKDRHSHHKDQKRDHKKSSNSSSSKDLQKLIKENEKSIKKEKSPIMAPPSGVDSPKQKNSSSSSASKNKDKTSKVKIETNDDGSIDAGSGCSFADALAGLDSTPKKKKKPLTKEEQIIEKPSASSSSHRSSSESSSSHSLKHKSSLKSHASSSSSSKDRSSSSSASSSSKKNKHSDTSMPELLKKPIKIENLDLDFNSTLPEINLNYRPLPHVPEHSRRNSTKSVTNEEEMFNMMMNKNQRTKVFSGGKSSFQQQVPSLYELCIKLLYDHIDGLEYTGGVPYDLLKPLLDKLNPDQLFVLEHYNPYLIEDTGTLWEFHCKKDFRSQKRQDMESWRDLYIRCMEEREEKLKALTQNITQSIAQSTPVRKVKLAYVDSAVKPPRNIAKKQARYGTGNGESSGISPALKSNMAEKREILNKAIVGSQNGSVLATVTVPAPPPSSAPRSSSWSTPAAPASTKKRKAPLMAKALQLIKGTNRFKR